MTDDKFYHKHQGSVDRVNFISAAKCLFALYAR